MVYYALHVWYLKTENQRKTEIWVSHPNWKSHLRGDCELLFHQIKCCIRRNHWPSTQDNAVISGGERGDYQLKRVRWHQYCKVGQYLDNRFFSSQSSNVKEPEKRTENELKVKNSKKEQEHSCELLCHEETKLLLKSEF